MSSSHPTRSSSAAFATCSTTVDLPCQLHLTLLIGARGCTASAATTLGGECSARSRSSESRGVGSLRPQLALARQRRSRRIAPRPHRVRGAVEERRSAPELFAGPPSSASSSAVNSPTPPSTPPTAQRRRLHRRAMPTPGSAVPANFTPISVTAVNDKTYWVLGTQQCGKRVLHGDREHHRWRRALHRNRRAPCGDHHHRQHLPTGLQPPVRR